MTTATAIAPASTPPTANRADDADLSGIAPIPATPAPNQKIEPAEFFAHGDTNDVLTRWAEAVQLEQLRDCPVVLGKVGFAPVSGALVVKAPSHAVDGHRYALAYCWHAFQQLFDRTGKTPCPRGAAAQTAYWASTDLRSRVFAEVRDAGHKDKAAVVRIGRDVHGANPTGRYYARAVVSEKHSAEAGDDLPLLRALMGLTSGEFGNLFTDGRASVKREPQGMTTGWFSTRASLTNDGTSTTTNTGAALSVRVENSETGCSSLRTAMYLSFSWPTVEGEEQPRYANVAIPVAKASSRTIHRGNPVAAAISKLASHIGLSMIWAPPALAKLAAHELHSDELTAAEADLVKRIAVDRQTDLSTARDVVRAAFTMAEKYSTKGRALNLVIVFALLRREQVASELVERIAGGI